MAALVALALSAYAIFTTRHFYKRQLGLFEMQKELSARQLAQEKQYELDASRADVGTHYVKEGGSQKWLRIINQGKLQAQYVRIEFS